MNNQPYNNDYETETPKTQQDNNNTEESENNTHTQQELDSIEYITPVHRKKHKKKKHKKSHSHSKENSNSDIESADNEADDFVFATPERVRKKKKNKNTNKKIIKVLLIILCVLLSIVVIATSTFFIFHQIGKNAMHDYDNLKIKPSPELSGVEKVENNGKVITYKNKKYAFNEDIATVALMGIDKVDLGTENGVVGTGGQADAIYIAIIDTKNKDVSMLSVSRDSMVDVDVYSKTGSYLHTKNMQLCLSYAYGDGKSKSAENTTKSLSRLFFNMQFDTYFAMDYTALHSLNDAIGGVTVTTNTDFFLHNENRNVKKGETITLYGEDAQRYIRARDLSQLDSNEARMERQKQYVTAFLQQAVPAAKKDLSVVTDLYSIISDNSTTNLNISKMTYLATNALTNIDSYKDIKFYDVPGSVTKGEKYAEYHVDEEKLFELMLSLFYEEVK